MMNNFLFLELANKTNFFLCSFLILSCGGWGEFWVDEVGYGCGCISFEFEDENYFVKGK